MGHNNSLNLDPALVKYNNMHVERYKFFRWTPRTAWLSLVWIGVIPGMALWASYKTEGKYILRGKRRGDTVKEF
ncbi:hypothetical protein AAFC00_007257 [Neodothiora populina]|uniref:NADH dehydrogenase [ubiquinone] 1 beta subcomplex subunit 4 n=1 Tax=Neodothiora populina TaxID=2781224 RepID=A0ABR3PHR5_9PEZI